MGASDLRQGPLLAGQVAFFGGARCLECLSVLQMKMPSKKFSHIPVYTLGFESPQRMSTAKTTPTQRRDAFQCVLPLVMFLMGWELGGGFSSGEGGQSGQSPESQFFLRKGFCGVDFALPGVGVGDAEARAEPPDSPVLPQIAARAAVAERGGGVPAHVHPRLCHEGRLQRLHRLRSGCGALQPQECGCPQHHAASCPPDPVPVCPEHLDTRPQVMTCSPWAAWQMLLKVPPDGHAYREELG